MNVGSACELMVYVVFLQKFGVFIAKLMSFPLAFMMIAMAIQQATLSIISSRCTGVGGLKHARGKIGGSMRQ